MKSNIFVIALLLLSACGKNISSDLGATSATETPNQAPAPVTDSVIPAPTPEPVVSPVNPEPKKVTAPISEVTENFRRIPLSQYEADKGSGLAIWDSRATAVLLDVDLGGDIFNALTDFANAGNPFYSRPKKKDNAVTALIKEYEKEMAKEYYFARVRKYRAPESAVKPADYTFFLAASPDYKGKTKSRPCEDSAKMTVGTADYLVPGGIGAGSAWIFSIPSDEVSSLGGLWDESITMQMAVLEIDKRRIQERGSYTAEEVTKPILVFEEKIDFYHMKKNTVYKKRYQTLTAKGTPDAILDVEFWKGNWRTNE